MNAWAAGVAGAVTSPIVLAAVVWGVRKIIVGRIAREIDGRADTRRRERGTGTL